jgi:Zn-dependent protease with chaperone function
VTLLAVLVALAPGLHSWWTGRALLARVNDPAFPELLLARFQRRVQVIATAGIVSVFIPGASWLWTFPLFVVALLVGNFPFRRALYGETWNVLDYVRYTLFGFVGMAGFWLSLALAPVLILALAKGWTPDAPVQGAAAIGAAFAVALVVWEYAHPLLCLALFRASPLRRSDLQPRFDDLVRRSAVSDRPPQVFRYGARGAYVMNAFAFPSTWRPRVAFGDTLLEMLTPDEIVAVFAHELSHLEYYNRPRLLRLRLVTYLLMLAAAVLPAVLLATASADAWMVNLLWLWPVIVLTLLALRTSKSQAHETESDLRAAALTGDPEAVVRALTKLHHYSRLPRRWPYDFERAASHPSLARRIQALRIQGQAAAPATGPRLVQLGAPTILRSTEPGTFAALDDSRAYWFEGVPAEAAADSMAALRDHATRYRAVAYGDLTELRVAVVRRGGRALLARDRTGKTWSMPLHTDDVGAAQQALDVLDVRLSNHVREDWPAKARLVATLLALALLLTMDFGWLWIPVLITLARPSAASVAAMGAMLIGRIVLGALAGTLAASPLVVMAWPVAAWVPAVATFAIGVWSCRLAWRWARGDERTGRQSFTLVTLACLATLLVGAFGVVSTSSYGSQGLLPLSLPSPASSLALLLVGVGAALITYRDALRRRSGAVLVILALAVGSLGAVFGGVERLLMGRAGPDIAWTTGRAEVVGRFGIDASAYQLHLSPSGHRFAVQTAGRRFARYQDEGTPLHPARYTIGTLAGARHTTEALDLRFLDDDRVLALRASPSSDDSLELSVEPADGSKSASAWRRAIPLSYAPTMVVDRAAGMWRVTGHDLEAGAVVIVTGKVGGDSVTTMRHLAATVGGRPLHVYRDGTPLIATFHTSGTPRTLLTAFNFFSFRWDIWRVVDGKRESVGTVPGLGFPECAAAGGRDETLLCFVSSPSRNTLWRLGAQGVSLSRLGELPAGLDLWDIGPDGRVAASSREGNTLAVVDVGTGRGTRVAVGGEVQLQSAQPTSTTRSYATDVAVAPGVVATLVVRDRKSEVTFYRVR